MCECINKRETNCLKWNLPGVFKDMGLLITLEKIILSSPPTEEKIEELAKYKNDTSAQGQQRAYKRMRNQAEDRKKREIQTDEPMAHL